MANQRRPTRKQIPNKQLWKAVETHVSEERLSQFRKAYIENGLNAYRAAIAIGMRPSTAKAHAHIYAGLCKLQIREALEARGYGPEKLTQLFISCLTAKSKAIRLQALDKAFKVRDDYPVPAPAPQAGVTVIFHTNIEAYEKEDHAPHTIVEQGSVPHEPQGNARSRPSQGQLTRGSVRDPAKSEE